MTSIMERFDDYWSGGDPVIKNRFLLKTIHPMFFIISSYVLFVKVLGPYIMRNRRPLQMRPLMIVYNFSLAIFYVWFLLRGALFVPQLGFTLFCGSMRQSENEVVNDVFFHGYILYVSRFVELLDTVFLVLSKKFDMVTPLHVFHHSIVPIFGWFGFRSETSGYLAIFIGVNSFVHVIMYTYYAIAALGPKYQKYIWWKKYLTSLQILQFFVMTIYMNFMYAFGCATSFLIFLFSNVLSVLFFFLFINYYREAYKTTKKQVDTQKNGVVMENGVSKVNRVSKENGILKVNGVSKENGVNRVTKQYEVSKQNGVSKKNGINKANNGVHKNSGLSMANKNAAKKKE